MIDAARPAVFAASRFVEEAALREPGLLASLDSSGELGRPRTPGEIDALARGIPEGDEAAFMDSLRRLRKRELVRIAWRDLSGAASLG